MTNFEMVELLRQKANVSYEEAKAALEAANWDLLDALVLLEKEGKVPEYDARFSTEQKREKTSAKREKENHQGFRQGMASLGRFLKRALDYGNRNFIVATKAGREIISLPLTAFVLLLIPMFWAMIILVIIGFFAGVRFSIQGAHPANDKVNDYLHKAESTVEHVKSEFRSAQENGDDSANS